jgi:acetyl-CoA C-acetyltransferase
MTDIVITAAKRTPVGSFLGAFGTVPAHELGRIAIEAALEQAGVDGADVSEVILGQVLTAAQGQNPARQASMAAGVPKEIPAWGVNQVCGSGLRAVALAAQAIATGDATIVVAGGQESMSLSAHAQNLRGGQKMGDLALVDTMVKDGLTDVFNGYHMGITAENLAEQYQVTRGQQDEFSVRSQNLADAARSSGRFRDEIAPVTVKGRKGDTIVSDDEYIRSGVTLESVSSVKPAFKKDGTVTAAQALSVGKELGWDADKVNVNGGAIAIGHPIGASGARVLTTLIYEMQKRDAKKGLATLCIGGGMGIAMCIER